MNHCDPVPSVRTSVSLQQSAQPHAAFGVGSYQALTGDIIYSATLAYARPKTSVLSGSPLCVPRRAKTPARPATRHRWDPIPLVQTLGSPQQSARPHVAFGAGWFQSHRENIIHSAPLACARLDLCPLQHSVYPAGQKHLHKLPHSTVRTA